MEDLTIRDAVVADVPALCAVRAARAQHEAKLAEAAVGTARFLVGVTGGEIVAFASVYHRHPVKGPPKSHIPKLSDCFVAPRYRSLGVGRALVLARERIARAAAFDHLYVSVDPVENPRWLDFFQRRGYRTLQPEPYRKGEPRYSDDGQSEEVLVWRQDLVVDLRRIEPACRAIPGIPSRVGTEEEMKVRRATPDDAVALAKVHIDSWRTAYRGLVPDAHLDRLNYERRAQRFRESLAESAQNPEETYLAEAGGRVLGFLSLGGCRDSDVDQKTTGEIWGIYLAPLQWRRGIGSLLCRYGERILRGRDYQSARLWVLAGNEQARRFYEAMGYATDGGTKMLSPGAPLEAVRYRKELREDEPSTPWERAWRDSSSRGS